MNLAIKIVVGEDKRQTIKLIWKFYIKPTSGSVYLKEAERDNDKMVQINS